MHQQTMPHHTPSKRPAPLLRLHMDDDRADVRQPLRQRAADWAQSWFSERPDALILMGCDGTSRNADPAHRRLRLRRLKKAMVRQGVPMERIRYTTEPVQFASGDPSQGQGVAWCRAVTPEDLEARGVQSIEFMVTD